jgi:hypothetical protein
MASDRTCSIDGCENGGRLARSWCPKHYQRWQTHGDPLHVPWSDSLSMFDRVLPRLDQCGPMILVAPELGPCWLWTGPVHPDGYAQVTGRGSETPRLIHRVVYEELVGPIPLYPEDHPEAGAPMPLDHLCHTLDPVCKLGNLCPHRRCASPLHLEPVSRQENSRRGRFPNCDKTHCKYGHPYDEANTYSAPSSPNRRQCRACAREHQRLYYLAKKAS